MSVVLYVSMCRSRVVACAAECCPRQYRRRAGLIRSRWAAVPNRQNRPGHTVWGRGGGFGCMNTSCAMALVLRLRQWILACFSYWSRQSRKEHLGAFQFFIIAVIHAVWLFSQNLLKIFFILKLYFFKLYLKLLSNLVPVSGNKPSSYPLLEKSVKVLLLFFF